MASAKVKVQVSRSDVIIGVNHLVTLPALTQLYTGQLRAHAGAVIKSSECCGGEPGHVEQLWSHLSRHTLLLIVYWQATLCALDVYRDNLWQCYISNRNHHMWVCCIYTRDSVMCPTPSRQMSLLCMFTTSCEVPVHM